MLDRDLQHPTITATERTGYPLPANTSAPVVCSACDYPIDPGKHYGDCDGRIICTDCIEDEWKELTAKEKFERLGYDSKFNG